MRRAWWIGIIAALLSVCVSANSGFHGKNLAFKHILPDQLESIEYIQDIVQDTQGFMWFGGRNGLARYDGYNLVFYRHDPERLTSVSSEQINSMLVSSDGTLWLGTGDGLNRYDPNTDSFVTYKQKSESVYSLRVNNIKDIVEWDDGSLWLATRGGLMRFFPQDASFTPYYFEVYPPEKGDRAVNVLAIQGNSLWIGQHTGGLSQYFPVSNTFHHFRHDEKDPNSLSDNDVRSLLVDHLDNIWVGTYHGGLNRLPPSGKGFVRYPHSITLKNNDIWHIIEDTEKKIWVADGAGLMLYDVHEDSFQRFQSADEDPRSLAESNVRTIFQDKAGDLWLGLFPSGIDVFDRQASVFRNFMPNASDPSVLLGSGVRDTYEDDNGNLWIATGQGLSFYDRRSNTFKHYKHHKNDPNGLSAVSTLSVTGDQDGYIWVGLWASGVNRLNPKTGEIKHYLPDKNDPNSFLGTQPWDMMVDHHGVLWIATNKSLNRYNKSTDDFTQFSPTSEQLDRDSAFYAKAVYLDSEKVMWVGSTRGLFRFDRKSQTFERFRHNTNRRDSLSKDYVISIYEDSRGYLWAGTKGGGVSRMDKATETFSTLNRHHGLPSNVVTSIIEDGQNNMWFSTHNGLARYNPSTKIIQPYFKRHGLSGNLFNRNTATLTRRGELLFGSTEGLTIFNPSEIWHNPYVPPIVITDFSILNKPVSYGADAPINKAPSKMTSVTLDHNSNIFSFTYSALNYRATEENQYAYFLEGFDTDWHYVGSKRTASYTNLDPGTYVFRVIGSNNDDVWNRKGKSVEVHILPPPWLTWWAFLFYFLCVASVVYWVMRNVIRQQKYEREHQLNLSLQELDKLKDEFLANTSHELRTPLNGIIGLSEALLEEHDIAVPAETKRKYLKMIHFSGKRLANLVDDILDFSKLKTHTLQLNRQPVKVDAFVQHMITMTSPLVGNKSLEFINKVPQGLPEIFADEKRLQQIFFNLIGNAVKFTDEGSITIDAKQDHKNVAIDVIDTGIGIPEAQLNKIFESFEQVESEDNRSYGGTGLGLTITKRLVELHNGSISVHSKVGVGSRFTLRIPVAATPT